MTVDRESAMYNITPPPIVSVACCIFQVPMARDGMYHKEFSVMFDWFHHTESLSAFTLSGLAVGAADLDFCRRTETFSGFYMGGARRDQSTWQSAARG